MSKKLLVIFGVTGQQGGSIIDTVLADPELSQAYTIRALTRDPSSASAKNLSAKAVEVVECAPDDRDSVLQALKGAHTVFAMTNTIYHLGSAGATTEIALGKLLADCAVESKATHLIWSSMISPTLLSSYRFTAVEHFDSKYAVEQYIRTLPITSSFFIPGSFMQNFATQQVPRPLGDGTYALFNIFDGEDKVPYIDIAADTGKFVGAMLAEPERYAGVGVPAATRLYSQNEIVGIMSRVSGKTVKHVKISVAEFEGYLPEGFRKQISEMMQYIKEVGYYGGDQEKEVEWGAKQARGKLTQLEEYFERCPLKLE